MYFSKTKLLSPQWKKHRLSRCIKNHFFPKKSKRKNTIFGCYGPPKIFWKSEKTGLFSGVPLFDTKKSKNLKNLKNPKFDGTRNTNSEKTGFRPLSEVSKKGSKMDPLLKKSSRVGGRPPFFWIFGRFLPCPVVFSRSYYQNATEIPKKLLNPG